jgi:peptidoglycan/LPS O-acetylase OafA/YrhL
MVLAASGVALAFAITRHGEADIGFEWNSITGSVPRVIYGFAAGVMIFRLRELGWFRFPTPFWAAIGAAILLLTLRAGADWRFALDILIVILLLPMVTVLGITARTPASLGAIFAGLGAASYALYALHRPVVSGIGRLAGMAGYTPADQAPWSGILLLLAMFALCLALERWFDRPVRKWLTVHLRPAPGIGRAQTAAEPNR